MQCRISGHLSSESTPDELELAHIIPLADAAIVGHISALGLAVHRMLTELSEHVASSVLGSEGLFLGHTQSRLGKNKTGR